MRGQAGSLINGVEMRKRNAGQGAKQVSLISYEVIVEKVKVKVKVEGKCGRLTRAINFEFIINHGDKDTSSYIT